MPDRAPPPPVPTELTLKRDRRELGIVFADGLSAVLSAQFLRVHSPSAEVTGHGAGEGVLVTDKENVAIERIDPVGRYAVRLVFDDGHDTGLYTWPILHEFCRDRERKWQRYLARLAERGRAHSAEE